ncbi:hypothetical protein M3194_03680 [Paenibacillus glycanilyticus]|uniref:hypothetical protein n=1 Tax=Paenibacillus glycanilyticus TaxID=126569 RepID=UPI002041CAA9|nr:hypothetical protein [Paenibacillus glycanilyticus]MCM3626469.1 hypothetical protein [Paenibacillus glycanilyticus]
MPEAVTATFTLMRRRKSGDESLRRFLSLAADDCTCVPISVCIQAVLNMMLTGLSIGTYCHKESLVS